MKKNDIQVGNHYKARVSGKIVTVRVDEITTQSGYNPGAGMSGRATKARTIFHVTNLATGRKTVFRSAQKFIQPVALPVGAGNGEPLPTNGEPLRQPVGVSVETKPQAGPSLGSKLAVAASKVAPHVIVEALAGTGKTTTLVEGLKKLRGISTSIVPSPQQADVWSQLILTPSNASVCFVAFNKSIATELQRRVPEGCSAMTMHSMGLKAVTAAFGRVRVTEYRIKDIVADLMGKKSDDLRGPDFEVMRATEKMVGLCKMNLIGTDTADHRGDWMDVEGFNNALDEIASHYEVELNGNRETVYKLVPQVLERCKDVQRDMKIDFNDMIWLPVALGLPVAKYDLLLVDECQDLNRCQQELAKMAGRRLVLCGDRHQAIYGFAGADARSMDRMQEELAATPQGCVTVPLTVTRRCGRAIVEAAQAIVAAFEAHESNGIGKISRRTFKGPEYVPQTVEQDASNYASWITPGDMALCRVNAPLVSQCLRFIKQGRKAEIQGRDVGQGLTNLVKKLTKPYPDCSVSELVELLDKWENAEREKELRKRNPSEARLIGLEDKQACILAFTEDAQTVADVLNKIDRVFTDDPHSPGIKFSTIHKAKGLEAKRVFLLEPEGATVPHPMAKSKWQVEQEWNLRYVAITRAIEELVYVK